MMGGLCRFPGTGYRSVAKAAPLACSGSGMCEAVLHDYGVGGLYQLATVCTHGDFIVLPHWNTMLPAQSPSIPLSQIILPLSEPVLALS